MINTTILSHSLQPFQFLSVCHYISSIGLLLYKNGLISQNEQTESIPVLNAFFEYLNNSTNETEAKRHLLQKVLNGTDLYGGGENETLDIGYIDDTFQYIISRIIFSSNEDIPGYIARIINRSKNVTLSILKETVFYDFSNNFIPMKSLNHFDNCSIRKKCNITSHCKKTSNLTSRAIGKIFNDYVWVIFPQAEADTNITDINYLYGMAGLKIAKNLFGSLSNLTFDDFVLLAHTTESMVLRNETSQSVLVSFSDPALFLYAYQDRNDFAQENLTSEFWTKAYANLFSYFTETTQSVLKTAFENSLYQKLENELSKLISRTKLAAEILKKFCDKAISATDFEILVPLFKTSQWFVEHERFGCNPDMPNLSEMFEKQFSDVRNIYKEIEKKSIQLVLDNTDLLSKIDSPNTSVQRAEIPIGSMASVSCAVILGCLLAQPQKPLDNIYFLFAIKQNGKTEFFALKQEENSLVIIPEDGNEENFAKEVGIDFLSNIAVARFTDSLKDENENSTDFIERVASIKTDDFIKGLYSYYYEETLGETVINGLLTLVPFYSCVRNIKDGDIRASVTSCSLDLLSLGPLVGVAAKYTNVLSRSLIVEVQKGLTVVNAGASFRAVGFSELIKTAIRTAAANVFPTVFFKDISIATIRTLDPGFEAFYRIGRFGVNYYVKLYRYILSNAKRLVISSKLLGIVKSVLKGGKETQGTITDLMPVVGQYNGHDLVRCTYPPGSHFFGPTFLKLFGRLAEMRTASKTLEKIPVVPSKVKGNEVFYKKVNPKNGMLSQYELTLDHNDLLRRVNNFVKLMETEGIGNQLVSYDVYHNKLEWKLEESGNLEGNTNAVGPVRTVVVSESSTGSESSSGSTGSSDSSSSSSSSDSSGSYSFTASESDGVSGIQTTSSVDIVELLKHNSLNSIRQDKSLMKQLQIEFYHLSLQQMAQPELTESIDLWFSEYTNNRNALHFLLKLKGGKYYPSDIMQLTIHQPLKMSKKRISFSMETKIIYHFKIRTQIGLVNLGLLDESLEGQFLISGNLPYNVRDVFYSDATEKKILNLELDGGVLNQETWKRQVDFELYWLKDQELSTPRLEAIERAVNIASSNVPSLRQLLFTQSLKKFYLKLEPSQSYVPTYEKFAVDFCRQVSIPNSYGRWRIENNKFIDDVLYKKNLDSVTESAKAVDKIKSLYEDHIVLSIQLVFESYTNMHLIRQTLRFEDYYAIQFFVKHPSIVDNDSMKRAEAAFYRLAIRQAEQEWAKESITVYCGTWSEMDSYIRHKSLKVKDIITMHNFKQVFKNRQLEKRFLYKRTDIFSRPIFLEIKLNNQFGVANLDRVETTRQGISVIPPKMRFVVDYIGDQEIDNQIVLVIKVHDFYLPKEEKIIGVIDELAKLLKSGTQFYID